MCLTIKLSPFVLKNPALKLIILQCPYLFSFMFSFWHCKTKSLTVNPELQQDMDLTRGKYFPLAKANKTEVQRASKPVCINVTASGRGRLRTFMKSRLSQGSRERLLCDVPRGPCWCPRETAGTGQGPERQPWFGCSPRGCPSAHCLFLRANQGKRNQSRRWGEFTTPDSNYNIRQFVLRCYCTFPVLITNYDSITPPWQFICSCFCAGRRGDRPLIAPFRFSERAARRLSSADTEEVRHCFP